MSVALQAQPDRRDQAADAPPVLRQKIQVVTLTTSVVDKNNQPITGLNRDDFEVYEDNIKQKIEYFSAVDAPVSIGIIFDASSSMQLKISRAREALKAFIDTSHPEDDFFLVAFNRQARLIADYTDGDEVLRRMETIRPEGDTALYDAVFLGLEKLKEARHKKRVLLVLSDGQDNCSRYNLRELSKNIKESEAVIYAISIAEVQGSDCGQLCQMYARRTMETIAEVTGGKAFFPLSLDDMEQATTMIALELRQQYSLGYVPTNTERDGKWRKISVRVLPHKGLKTRTQRVVVRTKEGYFAIP
ncbi:MAG TPA: VWA domain-containing protein [Blastocatellia bacterium]|nr:VWA domain-containing protein [Blastocatellia bacterium]